MTSPGAVWDAERGVWLLRLVLDRRPRNAQERLIEPSEDTMPHGTCFLEVRLGAQEQLRTWASDLPQWYYRMKVSAERARSNTFTAAIDAEAFRDTAAVQAQSLRQVINCITRSNRISRVVGQRLMEQSERQSSQ